METGIPTQLEPFVHEHTIVARAPGRINLIGEHTDYNEGFVLPAAIDKAAYLALTARTDDIIRLEAIDLHEIHETTIEGYQKITGHWTNYILGVVDQFKKKGVTLSGFDASLLADVPIGAGLSSSAAVECCTATALDSYLNTSFDKLTLTKMSQAAEHEFAGVQCGIMDQFASMFGKENHAIRLDCQTLEYEYLPLYLKDIELVLFDSGVKHSLASTEYNVRRAQCEEGVQMVRAHHPGISSLRNVTMQMLDRWVAEKDQTIYNRCKYVVEENARLLLACEDLKNADIKAFGQKMFRTHEGLSSLYQVSCRELDFLVNEVRSRPEVLGARMMGGGFGGCTLNLVKQEAIQNLSEEMSASYFAETGRELRTYIAGTGDGAGLLKDGKSM